MVSEVRCLSKVLRDRHQYDLALSSTCFLKLLLKICTLFVESVELGLPSRNFSRSLREVEIGEAMSILKFRAESALMDASGASCYSETSGNQETTTK